jgi:signal transduction histidine kinase
VISPPRSLSGRLLLGAAAFFAVSLVAAGLLIGMILFHFVQGQIDQRLDSQIEAVASAIETGADGRPRLAHAVDGPPFDHPRSGWYWQVVPSDPPLRSLSLMGADLKPPTMRQDWPWDLFRKPDASYDVGPFGEPLRLRAQTKPFGLSSVVIVVSAPQEAIAGPLRRALLALAASLGVLAAGLVGAILLQVRLGLRPLYRLGAQLDEVRSGKLDRLPTAQPVEVAPLIGQVNALLDQNAERLSRARRHAANLAHGLKTPLSTLSVALQTHGRDPDGSLQSLVTGMERQIRHHLRRARAATASAEQRERTVLAPRVADLAAALQAIYRDKAVVFESAIAPEIVVACEAQDLDEMLGNLMDNAFRWASGRVRAAAERDDRRVEIAIEDDGPGYSSTSASTAAPSDRLLDESAPGFGFGLSISRELAQLYGGELTLGVALLGGARATLTLPTME